VTDEKALQVGHRVRVTIERLVFQGDGLGRLADGRVIFVPYAAPGDTVEVRATEVREDFVRADLVRVLEASPLRVEPACRFYGTCGGCQWQHVGYGGQLHWKAEMLRELLERVGKLREIPVAKPIAPAGPWEYRARAQFKVFAGPRPVIGFHQRETHRVVDIDRCPLLDARVNTVLRMLRGMRHPALPALFPGLREIWVAVGTGTGEALVALFARMRDRSAIRLLFHRIHAEVPGLQGAVLLDGDPRQHPRFVDRHGHGALMEQVGEFRFRVDGTAFFQVSGLAAGVLTQLVLEAAALTGRERVLDLYAGVGTFTAPLARHAAAVVGVEASVPGAADAVYNLRANGCSQARMVQAQVEQALPGLVSEGPWDLVLLDPPRQGCSRRVLDAVAALAAPRLIYVSCDPSTLARDLGLLAKSGYRCLGIQPVDLFPQTFHLEAVATLQRAQ